MAPLIQVNSGWAHLSPGTPAVDVCILPAGADPVGPVLKSLGDTDGLAYPEVTPYLPLAAGTYGARIVAPNSADCSKALADLPDITGIQVKAGGVYTAAATGVLIDPGASDKAFAVELYEDDLTIATGSIRVRFIHASPDTPPVDVGLGSGTEFTPVWTNVAYPDIGLVGGKPYLETAPLTDATLSARASGTTADALVLPGVSIPADSVVTVFAIGNLDGMPEPLKVRACFDGKDTCVTLP
ncbi:MAG: DUF4397 domain-containing protein [Polyangiaceae bacterium]|nr:DUF4397 domain-containing protein [Polyangiaceae bacterium]